MTSFDTPQRLLSHSRLSSFVVLAATGTFAIAGLALMGWLFDIQLFKSVFPSFTAMKPNTIIGLILVTASLGALAKKPEEKGFLFLSRITALGATLMGGATLAQYLFGVDLGIDHLFFHVEHEDLNLVCPGRMSPMTSISLFLLGLALWAGSHHRTVLFSQILSVPVGLMGLLVLLSYLYGAADLVKDGYPHTLMAIHTAVAFLFLSTGVFFLHPEKGWAGKILEDTLGGWLLRRLAPVVPLVLFIIGGMQIWGENSGHFNSAFRIAIMMVVMIPLIGFALWLVASSLNRLDFARKEAEQVVRENEKFYRNQFADNSVVMLMINPEDGAIVDANKAAVAFYGYEQEQLLSMNITDINTLPPAEARRVWESVKKGQGGRFEFQHRLADGSVRDVAVSSSRVLFGKRMVLHSIIQDITDRKTAIAALQKSEEKYRLLTENAYDAVAAHEMLFNEAGRPVDYIFLNANPAFEAQTGLHVAEIIGRRVTEVLPGIESSLFLPIYGQVVRTGEPISFEQYVDQLGRHYCISAYSLGGNQFATVFADITDRKKSEEALKEREAFLKLLIEIIPTPVFATDREGRYVVVNKAFSTLFWKKKEEIIGKKMADICPPEIAVECDVELGRVPEEMETHANYGQVQDSLGVKHDVIFQQATLKNEEGEIVGVIGAILDITDFKRMEDELQGKRSVEKDLKAG